MALLLVAIPLLLLGGCGEGEGESTSDPAAGDSTTSTTSSATTTETTPGADGREGTEPAAEPRDDEALIEAAIGSLLSDPDSRSVCKTVVTDDFVVASYGDLQGCLSGRPQDSLARGAVKISAIEVAGERATAVAKPEGGAYDGVAIDVELVLEGRTWKVDGLTADIPVGP